MKFFGIDFTFNGFDIFHRGNFNPDSKAEVVHNHIIDDVTDLKSELDIRNIPFVVGTQIADTSAWTGIANSIETLVNGTTIRYWNPMPCITSTSVTLDLTLKGGGTTGAIPCYYGGTTRLTTHYGAGTVVTLTYVVNQNIDGTLYTGWWADANYDSNTNTYDRTYWANTITAGNAIYDYKLLMQGIDGKFYPLTLESGTATTKTISTQEFIFNCPILFYNSTTNIGLNGTTTNVYSEIPITVLHYTANQSSWISQKPIYLKGTINANSNFVLDNTSYTSFMTQDLPTTEDGFVYIMLGYMYGTTSMRLMNYHPSYEYRNGKLRPYSGLSDIFDTKAPLESPTFTGTVTAPTFSGALNGNADTASKLQTAININLVGDVTGSTSFDGLTDVNITTTVADDSHNHSNYLPLSGGTITGGLAFSDVSKYLLYTATNWGIYWNTTDNTFEFRGAGVVKSSIDLDTGTYTGNVVGAVTGNASTASKWATARTLSLTGDVAGSVSIDGNADATITAVVADDSHNHIISNVDGLQTALDGKASLSTATATLSATAGWYRIATSAVDIGRCSARFEIDWALSGVHGQVTLNAGIMYGTDATLNSIHYSHYGTKGLTKVRIVYHTTYSGNYAYLEVYNTGADAIAVTVQMFSSLGWTLVAPNTLGEIPTGYTSQELTFVDGIATEGVFSGSGANLTNLNASALASGTVSGSRGVTSGSTSTSFLMYNGTTNSAGRLYGGTTTPTGTTRLNYSGYFYPTYLNLLGSADTTTTATHYFVEQASDGFVRPKTLANVKTEIVTSSAITTGLGYTPANIDSPTFTGTPSAPTPTATDDSTNIATTAFVKAQGYITSAQAGTVVTTSAIQPVGSKTGDVWIATF